MALTSINRGNEKIGSVGIQPSGFGIGAGVGITPAIVGVAVGANMVAHGHTYVTSSGGQKKSS